jgi:cAMP phosphodiesterase
LVINLRVLGCHGGELPKHRTTCFLLDGTVALDAGAICATLRLEDILKIDHILLTHSHFDHVKDVPMMADLLTGRRDSPVVVHASPECIRTLQRSIFNDQLWPDFTTIPSPGQPVIRLEPFEVDRPFKLGAFTVTPVPVHHPVESMGFVIEKGRSSIAISGDTGPTDALWDLLNRSPRLKALLLETSFPNALQKLADASGHLTPRTMRDELENKLHLNGMPVLLYHLKPAFSRQLRREIDALHLDRLRILELDDEFKF